jgi:hypothetical protein
MRINEMKEVSASEWDKQFAGLSARAATGEIYANVLFRYGYLRARVYQLQADGPTIRLRLYPRSPQGIEGDGIHVDRPTEDLGSYHVLDEGDGGKLITMGFPLCQHLEYAELQIATSLELFDIEDSPSLVH